MPEVTAAAPAARKPLASTTAQRSRFGALNNSIFYLIHLGCLGVFFVEPKAGALAACAVLYFARMFAITAGYHRLFSHRSYSARPVLTYALAAVGAASAQRGPIWWAAHHRNHHRYSDGERDIHAPRHGGLWWSHAGWILSPHFSKVDEEAVPDLTRDRILLFIERRHFIFPVLLALSLGIFGGASYLVWGFFVSTTVLYHATFTINSLAHVWGRQPYATGDDSRNNPWLAALTLGEGWHNNHHRYPASERQGFFPGEIDLAHVGLRALEKLGLASDLRRPPDSVLAEANSART